MSQKASFSKFGAILQRSSTNSEMTPNPQLSKLRCDPPIIPKFWKRKDVIDQSTFTIDCQRYDMSDGPRKIPELRQEILTKFKNIGVVLLKNTNLGEDLVKMSEWARVPMGKVMKYEGGASNRKELAKNVYDVGAPKNAYLHYHHEMAYLSESVSMLAFCAKSVIKPTPDDPYRGATFLSDNLKVTDDILKTNFGKKLRDLGVCYIRCLTDQETGGHSGVYNFWQTSFLTESKAEVERLAAQKGLQYAWGPGRYFRTKSYRSAYEYFPQLNRNLLYGSLAHHSSWFDTWEGISDMPDLPDLDSATPEHKPLKMVFGDDSEMTRDDLELYGDVYDRHGFPLVWEHGDVGIFCNYRFAHGRAKIDEKEGENREVGIVLGPMFNRVGPLVGKW